MKIHLLINLEINKRTGRCFGKKKENKSSNAEVVPLYSHFSGCMKGLWKLRAPQHNLALMHTQLIQCKDASGV